MAKQQRSGYPSDVSDEEWEFVAPYLTLCREDAPQRSTHCARCSTRCVCGASNRIELTLRSLDEMGGKPKKTKKK